MAIDFSPTLKPLFHEVEKISVCYYLASTDFERDCNKHKFEDAWDDAFKHFRNSTNSFMLSYDPKPFDCQCTLIGMLNFYFKKEDRKTFDWLIYIVLKGFMSWTKKEINLDNILTDLELLHMNMEYLSELKQLYYSHKSQFSKSNQKVDIKKIEPVQVKIFLNEKKKNWKKIIAKGGVEKVVDEIIDFGVENENDIIALSSRWKSLQNRYHKSVIRGDDYDIEHNKIVYSLLDFIESLEDTDR